MKGGLEDKMVNYLFEKGADLFPLAKRAEGLYLETADGKRYLDFASATFNLSLGYSHPDVVQAVKDLLDTGLSYVSTSFKLDVISAFAKKLVSLCPDNLTRVHLKCTGGSTANEGAIKAALKVTGKNDLVTYYYGYHGQTYLTQALTGYHLQRNYLPPIGLNVIRIPFPYCYRCFFGKKYPDCAIFCLKKIAQILDSSSTDGPACLIMEPILGIGGCVVPPKRYMKGIAKFCSERKIPLIMDEVMTGVGRIGKMFAFEHFGIKPNIITLAKGLGGSGFGAAAIVAEERFAALTEYEHSFTATSFLIGAAAALKTLEIVSQPTFLKHVTKMGKLIRENLLMLKKQHSFIGDVRGLGLMQGIEIVDRRWPDPKRALRIVKKAFDKGLFIRCYQHALANTILITPALIITEEEVRKGLKILEDVLKTE